MLSMNSLRSYSRRLTHLRSRGSTSRPRAGTGPLLRRRDGLAEHLLAGGVAAVGADVERQVDADVGVVGHDREPDLGGHVAHARDDDLVLARQPAQRAGVGDVGGLMRGRRGGDGVVELLGLDTGRDERLGRAGRRRAQAALAAGVEHLDTALLDVDGIHGACVQARVAGAVLMAAQQARDGVGARALLVVRRVPVRRVPERRRPSARPSRPRRGP